jgi:hypothetical protein
MVLRCGHDDESVHSSSDIERERQNHSDGAAIEVGIGYRTRWKGFGRAKWMRLVLFFWERSVAEGWIRWQSERRSGL